MSIAARQTQSFNFAGLRQAQNEALRAMMDRVQDGSAFYRRKFKEAGISFADIKTIDDLAMVPFTTKQEIREEEALVLQAVPDEKVVRIHSSSGTTGKPIVIPYTRRDVETWADMFARCYAITGVTGLDRVQITPGYGLWTAGIGFQAGAEKLGAMAIPMGPGNTEKQLSMMVDLKSTVLTATASYGLLLAEEIKKRDLREKVYLRLGIFGSERWGDKMRQRIEEILGIETFDIYGLTEIYGPGIGIDCPCHQGIHYFTDHLLFEIIDPESGKVLPPGEIGELVVTTLTKEGAPLIRYRTRDLTRMLPERCSCGSDFPMIDRILGRSDDAFKVKGVMLYPGQIEDVLKKTGGLSSEYRILLEREAGKDFITVVAEAEPGEDYKKVGEALRRNIKNVIGFLAQVNIVDYQTLDRSEKKTRRVEDRRNY